MSTQRILHTADAISTWVGKAAAWLIVALMLLVCAEVFKRYILNMPTAWIFDVNNMLYGTLFMLGGAYTLAHDGHVRGDFFYGSMKPRTQARIDFLMYLLFFIPGIAALTWAGWTYFQDSLGMREQTFNATPIPLYPFKFVIPVAGAIVLMQGLAEMLRCLVCMKTGEWTPRLPDAQENDVVAQQLAGSEHIDEDARQLAIEQSRGIKG
jgi:TRAP-type mannitol/chloroaromatic compound transport system permease small subunit